MITVRLIGGLGNQMFQYAAGRALALRRGVPLRLDLGWYADQPPQDTPRAYELDVFRCDAEVEKVVVRLREPRTRLGLARVRLGEALGRRSKLLRQQGTGFDARVLDAPDGTHLVGYWQSERYFQDAADHVRRDFTPRDAPSDHAVVLDAAIRSAPNAVSLHVRRGDYLTNPHALRYHGVLDVDYYRHAVELVTARVGDVALFVFSDDPDWCEEELVLGYPTTVVRAAGRPAWEDLALMSACRHHVIANSSFSWWGAWLGDRGGVVVAPKRWAIDAGADFTAVYAEGWLTA